MSKQIAKSSAGFAGLEYYGFRDYKSLFLRHKWGIATTALTVALAVAAGAYLFPNLYQASAVILVDPGKVPESYVKSTATIDAKDRLAILQAQILSAPRLGKVADEMGIRGTRSEAETVTEMLRNLTVEPVTLGGPSRELQAFKVSYESNSPSLAARVANRVASLFIEENMKVREQQVLGTADFFDRELEKAKQELDEKGKKLAELRSHYIGSLPNSQNLHLQALTSAQMELRSEMDATDRAQQQKVYLQSLLADTPAVVDLDHEGSSADAGGLQEERQRLLAEMDQLRAHYGPSHPDVLTKAAEIQNIDKQIKEAEPSVQLPKPSTDPKPRNPVLESQIAQLGDEIQKHEARQKELKSQIAYFQSSLEEAPEAEQQLTAASNDYENAEDRYKRLEDHKFSADMSSDVETRQKGERFILLDPAQPPEHPYLPNRPLIDGLGLVGGMAIALFLAFAIELLDGTVRTQRELAERLKISVFGEIPWLATDRKKKRVRSLSALAAGVNVVLALGYVSLLAAGLR